MTIQQIAVFVSNKAGGVADVVETISKNGINIRALSIADTADFGILRLIVDDVRKTAAVLSEANFVCSVTNVIAAHMDDCPGGLAGILRILSNAGIDIEYMYAFVTRQSENAFVILRLSDTEEAAEILENHHIRLVSPEEVASL